MAENGVLDDAFAPAVWGLRAWTEWINSQGGIGGRTVELFTCDDREDRARSLECARRLVEEDQVFALVATNSRALGGAAPYLNEQGIPVIGIPITNSFYRYPHFYSVYGGGYPNDGTTVANNGELMQFTSSYRWFRENLGATNAAVFSYDIAESSQAGRLHRGGSALEGYTDVARYTVSFAAPSFDQPVADMQRRGTQVIFDAMDDGANRRLCDAMARRQFTVAAKVTTVVGYSAEVGTAFNDTCRNSMFIAGDSIPYTTTPYRSSPPSTRRWRSTSRARRCTSGSSRRGPWRRSCGRRRLDGTSPDESRFRGVDPRPDQLHRRRDPEGHLLHTRGLLRATGRGIASPSRTGTTPPAASPSPTHRSRSATRTPSATARQSARTATDKHLNGLLCCSTVRPRCSGWAASFGEGSHGRSSGPHRRRHTGVRDRGAREGGVLGPDTSVAEVDHEEIGVGVGIVGQLARLGLRYDGQAAGAPGTVILKIPSEYPENRQVADHFNFYEREGRFYQQIGDKLGLRTPGCYWNHIDVERQQFGLLLEDLGTRTMISQVAGVGADRAAEALSTIGALHGTWWSSPALDGLDWLPRMDAPVNIAAGQQYRDAWPSSSSGSVMPCRRRPSPSASASSTPWRT